MNAVLDRVEPQSQAQEAVTKGPALDITQWAREGRMPLADLMAYADQLQSQGHLQAACNLYGLWLGASQDPRRHVAYFNYGTLLQSNGQSEQAMLAYQAALAIDPQFAQANINLGLTLERLDKSEQALQAWARVVGQRLLSGGPSVELQTTALNHIGRVQEQLKQYVQAEQALEDSLRLNPRQPGVIQHWVHIRQKACKWPVYKALPGISMGEMVRATSPLAMLALTDDPVQQLLTAQSFVGRTYSTKEERLSDGRIYQAQCRLVWNLTSQAPMS
jgi:predicted O-linked N-acetylglucosamine transferase (SPINDLY family)